MSAATKKGGELQFYHLSLRADGKSTIVTTNLAFNRWDEIIQDKVLVSALVDRIIHQAYLINMKENLTDSRRRKRLTMLLKIQ